MIDATQEVWQQADLRRWFSGVARATGNVAFEWQLLLEAALERYHRKEIVSYDPEIDRRLDELGGE